MSVSLKLVYFLGQASLTFTIIYDIAVKLRKTDLFLLNLTLSFTTKNAIQWRCNLARVRFGYGILNNWFSRSGYLRNHSKSQSTYKALCDLFNAQILEEWLYFQLALYRRPSHRTIVCICSQRVADVLVSCVREGTFIDCHPTGQGTYASG